MTDLYFSGQINRIIFENPSNFFKIILIEVEDTNSDYDYFELIVTGTIAEVIEGESYTFWGELTQHPKYGEQLKVSRYQRAKPTSSGLINYFSSDHFKGIGKKTAEKILELYGNDPIDKILEDPSKLDNISGISDTTRKAFVAKLKRNYGTEQILSKLADYGITNRIAVDIFDKYKETTLEAIQENPYQLVEDIQGIGFKIADQLAEKLGIEATDPKRFRAAIVHSLLETSLENGDTYVEAKELLTNALYLLEDARQIEIEPTLVAQEFEHLIAEDKIQTIGTRIFANTLFYAEEGIKKQLTRIMETPLKSELSKGIIDQEITHIEQQLKITYDNTQKEAIQKALTSKVFILTGGPGTGKTTVINGIIQAYGHLHGIDTQKNDVPITLAAPTGRAARRMNELTGLPAATIHRHLGINGDNSNTYQAIDDYLDCELIIIDEFSMVDTWLANQLFASIASHTQVIIVGDSDQLPSVGPGQVLADLLAITKLPKLSLTKIFRQSEESTIVTLASQLRNGSLPSDFTDKKADRSYFEALPQHIPNMVEKIVQAALKSGISAHDIQILAPMYRGQAGITNLNTLIQNLINPSNDAIEFAHNDQFFRTSDKVLHLVNDSENNVFNGDIGYISELIPAKYTESKQDEITIQFDGNEVTYLRNEWHKITLAYAMSIHKAQGSEFQVVILPITRQSNRMLQRNLIYTAITRSKSKLIMLGELSAFDYAVKTKGASRKTYLVERFDAPTKQSSEITATKPERTLIDTHLITDKNMTDQSSNDRENYRLTEENWQTIDPMIGLTDGDSQIFLRMGCNKEKF